MSIAASWKAAKPQPEDLLKQLSDPFQLKLLKGHTQLRLGVFPIGPAHTVGATEIVRTAWSIASVSEVLGLTAVDVQHTIDSVARQIRGLRKL